MDNYLESLVVKEEVKESDTVVAETEEIVDESVEGIVDTSDAVEIDDSTPAEIEDMPIVANNEEEVVSSSEIALETSVPDESGSSEEVADVISTSGPVVTEEVKAAQAEFTSVTDIKIFNSPDPKGPFKIFTGNVIIDCEVSEMKQIQYMKPGFGLVKGFTPDLK